MILCLHETRSKDEGQKASSKEMIRSALNETVLRSSKMLLTEFVVSTFTLWSSFSFGTVFIMTQSIPLVYTELYIWPAWKSGVIQVAILIGEVLGFLLCLLQDTIIYPRHMDRQHGESKTDTDSERGKVADSEHEDTSLPPNPEARLYTSVPASIIGLVAGFFIYGWTSQPEQEYTWPLLTLGLLLIGIGIMVIVQAVTTYITDCYPNYANSAVSAVAFGENMFAAFLPLATKDMYNNLGFSWASSLLGFLAIGVSAGPLLLILFGPKIRNRSAMIG